jgi:NAD-dependent dihydropyrimidine dehydrogenase PreA subunit
VIGYEVGPRGRTRPVFIYDQDAVDRLVWNQYCTHNLTTYLTSKLNDMDDRIAIVLKSCDSKAFNVLLSENKVDRQRVHIIGVVCKGILQEDCLDNPKEPTLQLRCQMCGEHTPYVYDHLIGEADAEQVCEASVNDQFAELDNMPPASRAEFWLSQFDRCIRCYACRQACPMCDCPTCLYERDDSLWVGIGTNQMEKRVFHLGRAMHLAGRCIGCNECERVCPMNIPIGLLNEVLAKEIKTRHQFIAGIEPAPSPITSIIGEKEQTA